MSEQEQGRVGGTGIGQREQWDKGKETYQEAVVGIRRLHRTVAAKISVQSVDF